MRPDTDRQSIALAAAVGIATAVGSFEPIRNYDYFWHLATGRWILEHRALPARDPFTLASHDGGWINLEWLFQITLYPLFELLGHDGLTILLAVLAGLGTAALFLYARTRTTAGPALLLSVIAWLGAAHRIDLRPETAAIPLFVLFIVLLLRSPRIGSVFLLAAMTTLWFAVHPSALLAPVLASLVLIGSIFDSEENERERKIRFGQVVASGVALLLNPWFFEGVLAPVRLATLLQRERLVNLEWLPSSPSVFPELYAVIAGSLLLLALRRLGKRGWSRALLFAFLGFLAVRYVRNHAFFYSALPVLLAPSIGTLHARWDRLLMVGAAFVLVSGLLQQDLGVGIDRSRFPERVIARLDASGLEGNVYTPDQLGGYLVWSFYPERRVLVDGRNELYIEFFRRFAEARENSRSWFRLLDDYDLDLAVEEYRNADVEMVDSVTGERRYVPPSTVYFPVERWALIGFDEAAMLFARRESFPVDVVRELELISVVPDAARAEDAARGEVDQALRDLVRLKSSTGTFPRLERLTAWLVLSRSNDRSVDQSGTVE